MSTIAERLGQQIKMLRQQKGWSQKDLAELIGEKNGTVSTWENGTRFPREDKLEKLVELFNVSYDSLMGYAPREKNPQLKAEDFTEKDFEFLRQFKALPLEEQEAILTLAKVRTQNNQGHDE